jgi:hypothetical protein
MKLNMISNAAVAANAQSIRHQLSVCTFRSGRLVAAEQFGAGFMVLPRPWSAQASDPATGFAAQRSTAQLNTAQLSTAQLSTAPTSGPCASKQYQQMAPAFATSGGEVGPHPPREPV